MEIQDNREQSANDAARISPFEQLPVEILSEIMNIYFSRARSDLPTTMQICRRLRHVVLGLPTLWCNIKILSPRDHLGPRFGYKYVCEVYLSLCSPFLLTEN
jgi:hypothetical protein